MKNFIRALVLMLVSALMLAACSTEGPGTTADSSTVAAVEDTDTAADSDTPAQPAAEDPDTPAPPDAGSEPILIVGYNAFSDAVSFSLNITNNMIENAEARGIQLLIAETNGDPTTAMANFNAFVAQGAQVVVDSSWNVAAAEAMARMGIEHNIPVISIDIPVEDSFFMGVNNSEAGRVAGRAAVEYVEANWDSQVDMIFISYDETAGEVIELRMSGIVDAILDAGISVPESNIIWVSPADTHGTVGAMQAATDFLTAHPDASRIVMAGFNDQTSLGLLSAVETSNRGDDVIIVSHGADDPALHNLRHEDNSWIGSVGYFPERYGDFIFQIIDTLDEGGTPPHHTYIENIFVDRDNLNEIYPE